MIRAYLSPHFLEAELTRTSCAVDNTPPADARSRLEVLCWSGLEPLRSQFGPILITSGYRSDAVQAELKRRGRPTARDSAHCYGCAADLLPIEAGVTLDAMMLWLTKSTVPYDQIIIEHMGSEDWLHLGFLRPNHEPAPRRQALRYDPAHIAIDGNPYSLWSAT